MREAREGVRDEERESLFEESLPPRLREKISLASCSFLRRARSKRTVRIGSDGGGMISLSYLLG